MIDFIILLIMAWQIVMLHRIYVVAKHGKWLLDVIGVNIENYRKCTRLEELNKISSITQFLLDEFGAVNSVTGFWEQLIKFWRDPESFYSKEFLKHINEINK